jgi:hypothetical protein
MNIGSMMIYDIGYDYDQMIFDNLINIKVMELNEKFFDNILYGPFLKLMEKKKIIEPRRKKVSKKFTKVEWQNYYNNHQPPIIEIPNDCLNIILSYVAGNKNKYNNICFFPSVCKKWNKLKRTIYKNLNIVKPPNRYIFYNNSVKTLPNCENFNFHNQDQFNRKLQNYKPKKNQNNIHQPRCNKYQ